MSQTPIEHRFAQYIRIIGKGKTGRRSLTVDEAQAAMDHILAGDIEQVQLGAFLMVLRVKEESAEEIAGFVMACRASINKAMIEDMILPDLDWPSYAGKKRQPPWFILTAVLLAQSGYRVFMHGSSGHTTNRLYTETVLTELGINPADSWNDCQQQLTSRNFSYLPLEKFCPELQQIIDLRPLLGLRSPVHTLVRLLNPLGADTSLQSVFHPAYSETHHQAAQLLGQKNAAVFKGEGGEVECRPYADVAVKRIYQQQTDHYSIKRTLSQAEEIPVDSKVLTALWEENESNPQGLETVLATTAVALHTMGVREDFQSAKEQARQLWENRNATIN